MTTEGRRPNPRASGVTLLELMVAVAITAIIALLATQTYVAFVRDSAMRRKVTAVQGGTRFALDPLSREFRQASLGAGTGRIWTASGASRVARPAVQIFSDLSGAGTLALGSADGTIGGPKPLTDALLVVEAVGVERGATVGDLTGATAGMPRTFNVTTSTTTVDGYPYTLAAGQGILVGDYLEASWAVLETVSPTQLTIAADLALPGAQLPQLPAGALVRRARARLYYVDAQDQLVRIELGVPRAPLLASEILGREVIAAGIENFQVFCEAATSSGALEKRTAALAAGHAIVTESAAAFTFGAGGGPMLHADDTSGAGSVAGLRTIVLNVTARSATPIVGSTAGDERVALEGVALGDTANAYVRRSYQLALGVRNTSLGDL